MMLFRNMLKKVGESRHPCQTPTVVWNQSSMMLLKRTALIYLRFKKGKKKKHPLKQSMSRLKYALKKKLKPQL